MTDTVESGTISAEAFERVKQERDQLKAQVAELGATVKDYGYVERARRYFSEQQVQDADHWADVALPHIRNVELDQVGEVLTSKFGNLPKMNPAPTPAVTDDDAAPAPTEPVRPAVAGPNPAAPGEPASTQRKLRSSDPEVREVMAREGYAGLRRLINEGRVEFHPQNNVAGGLRSS